jgi:hypothetical protein
MKCISYAKHPRGWHCQSCHHLRRPNPIATTSQLTQKGQPMRHKPNPATQCQHRTKDRKQCHMPACPRQGVGVSVNLCPHHQRTAANQIYQSAHPIGCSDFRSGESSDSHSVDVPIATAAPNHAPKNPPPPTDDPPPSTHPQHTPLPRWGEQHFSTGTYSEPSRPNQFGPPRMSARRTQRYANLKVRHNEARV